MHSDIFLNDDRATHFNVKIKINHLSIWIPSIILLWMVFILYLSIAPTNFTVANNGGDGGDFLSAVLTGGVPHPSGYPTYLIFATLFQYLPFGSPFFRGVLASIIPAVFAVFFLSVIIGYITRVSGWKSLFSPLGGVFCALSPLFWSQAVIVEVHGLNALFVVLAITWVILMTTGDFTPGRKTLTEILCVLLGLGLGNHLTFIFFFPLWGFILFRCYRSGVLTRRMIFRQAIAVFLGCLIYVIIPLRAQNFPAINWGNAQSWSGFFWLFSGEPYHELISNQVSDSYINRLGAYLLIFLDQFSISGIAMGLFGLMFDRYLSKVVRLSFLIPFISYFIFSSFYATFDSHIYLLASIIIFSFWIGLGAVRLIEIKISKFPLGIIIVLFALGFQVTKIPEIIDGIDPRKEIASTLFAEDTLNDLPTNAILITQADQDTFPLWYYHFGLGLRQDIHIVVYSLTYFEWYRETLEHVYPDLSFPSVNPVRNTQLGWMDTLIFQNRNHPICHTFFDPQATYGVRYSCADL